MNLGSYSNPNVQIQTIHSGCINSPTASSISFNPGLTTESITHVEALFKNLNTTRFSPSFLINVWIGGFPVSVSGANYPLHMLSFGAKIYYNYANTFTITYDNNSSSYSFWQTPLGPYGTSIPYQSAPDYTSLIFPITTVILIALVIFGLAGGLVYYLKISTKAEIDQKKYIKMKWK